jgi:hypothetical protein
MSSISPVAGDPAIIMAQMASAERFSPLRPLGIDLPLHAIRAFSDVHIA